MQIVLALGCQALINVCVGFALLSRRLWNLLQCRSGAMGSIGGPGDDQPSDWFHEE